MQWIKKVVKVDSVDESRSSTSIRAVSMPNFEILDKRIASALRILGDCWQWESNGQCVKGDNCSFCHDVNKCGKITKLNPSQNSFMQQNERNASRTRSPRGKSPSGRMSRWSCKDYLRGTCNNSSCKRWHPPECLFYKSKNGCRFGEKCSFAHRQVDTQPTKRSDKNDGKSVVVLLKVTIDFLMHGNWELRISRHDAAEVHSTEVHRHAETNPTCETHEGYCTSF